MLRSSKIEALLAELPHSISESMTNYSDLDAEIITRFMEKYTNLIKFQFNTNDLSNAVLKQRFQENCNITTAIGMLRSLLIIRKNAKNSTIVE